MEKHRPIEDIITELLKALGQDPETDDNIKDTPKRYAKALQFLTSGYTTCPEEVVGTGIFQENHDEMVIVKEIAFYSLCEHHLLPFCGQIHIGYIPDGKVLGLSKLARIAEVYSRRLSLQERLTKQIANAIMSIIQPLGVAVTIEATHMCMTMRGVQKTGSQTVTSSMLGVFRSDARTRDEFLSVTIQKRLIV